MAAEAADALTVLGNYSNADIFSRPASAVREGLLRLEAGYYGSEGYRAVDAMTRSGFEISRIEDKARVTWFGPFSRTYVDEPTHGTPFLSSSDMLAAKLEPDKYLSNVLTTDLSRLLVREGTILVSCSGTIGNVCICTQDYNGFAISQHAIRVNPVHAVDRGALYLFLLSEVGRFLLTRSKSGSVIESIYAEDVEHLPFPLLPKRLRLHFKDGISRVSELRTKANRLLAEADREVLRDCRLESLPDIVVSPSFAHSSRIVLRSQFLDGDLRLDATFFAPQVLGLRQHIRSFGGVELDRVVSGVLLIGKTFVEGVHKVERQYGVGYFTGKELFKIRPIPQTFITSARRAAVERLVVERGTTLITCAGTIGKVAYVRGPLEGCAVTHDAIRVVPGEELHAGYVFAFLSSRIGRMQLERCAYGSVIPRLYRTHVEKVLLPRPKDKGEKVADFVDRAFDMRAEALRIENGAVEEFLAAIRGGRAKAELKWGAEY